MRQYASLEQCLLDMYPDIDLDPQFIAKSPKKKTNAKSSEKKQML
jgi:hypothetical protein